MAFLDFQLRVAEDFRKFLDYFKEQHAQALGHGFQVFMKSMLATRNIGSWSSLIKSEANTYRDLAADWFKFLSKDYNVHYIHEYSPETITIYFQQVTEMPTPISALQRPSAGNEDGMRVPAESSGVPITTSSSSMSNATSPTSVQSSSKACLEGVKWETTTSMEAKSAAAPNATQGNRCFVGPTLSKHEVDDYIAMVDNEVYPKAPPTRLKSVVIIGAGLSGLAAARELQKAGLKVIIMEASHRAGGRCYTMISPTFSDGVYAEAGGMRFPSKHKIMMKYIEKFSLETCAFSNMKDNGSILFFDGMKVFVKDELKDPNSLLSRVLCKWKESIEDFQQDWQNGVVTWEEIVKKYGNLSLQDFLLISGWDQELLDGFSKYGLGLGPYKSILHLSFVEILRLNIDSSFEFENLQIKGGMEKIVQGFLHNKEHPLDHAIRYGCTVTAVCRDPKTASYEVSYRTPTSTSELYRECDFVICTAPLPRLSSINFEPSLKPDITEAINNAHYVRASKIFIETKSRFWLKHGIDGMITSDLLLKSTYFAPPFENSTRGLIIASYIWEDDAEVFLGLTDADKISLAVGELSKIFPELEIEFERGGCVEWNDAFCIFTPGQMHYQQFFREEISPNVFLAGEHCSCEHGYFEGALESGLRAAQNILHNLDKLCSQERLQSTLSESGIIQMAESGICKPTPLQSHHSVEGRIMPLRLDHYTLIVDNAKEVSDFHVQHLGFKFLRVQNVNSGTVGPGEYDMINYVLSPQDPNNPNLVLVVTEGLNDRTIFKRYLNKFGVGIHHVAFEVMNIEHAFALAQFKGIETTSNHITEDILSGLKQFFISPNHAGFFIELIERRDTKKTEAPSSSSSTTNSSRQGYFHSKNMGELAQSIERYVQPEPGQQKRKQEWPVHSIDNSHSGSVIVEALSNSGGLVGSDSVPSLQDVKRGGILAIAFRVVDPMESRKFLADFLNFRMIRSNKSGDQTILALPMSESNFNIVIEKARSTNEARSTTVYFDVDDVSAIRPCAELQVGDESFNLNAVLLSEFHTSYQIAFTTTADFEPYTSVVRRDNLDLFVYIHQTSENVLDFLEYPANLTQWTGHKNIKYSDERKCWVEVRRDSAGDYQDFDLAIDRSGRQIQIGWPERGVKVVLECSKVNEDSCTLLVTLPSNLPERRIAAMKHIISVELNILKALLEGNEKLCIADHQWQQVESYHLSLNGHPVDQCVLPSNGRDFGFKGTILKSGHLVEKMSTDFAMTIRSKPTAVLLPTNVQDIRAIVHLANERCIPIVARGSQVSHSAGGQAQCNGGLLIDMSCLDIIEMGDNHTVKVGPGVMWDAVIRATLDDGLMPPVVNDYQYLSVGGTISVGGVGFMSHQEGLQAGHIEEMEIVTGAGDLIRCSKDEHSRLFDFSRAGLGQYGIITSLTLPLIPAPKNIAIFKLFYKEADLAVFTKDVTALVDFGKINMIHSFLKPGTSASITQILGRDIYLNQTSIQFKSIIHEEEELDHVVFFLELGLYLDEKADMSMSEVRNKLATLGSIDGATFESILPFYDYLTRDPPVVETNKIHGCVPHPSFAVIVGQSKINNLLQNHLQWRDKDDDAVSEILVIPLKSNLALQKGHPVPMFPMPQESLAFFVLFLGSVVGDRDRRMEEIRAHHRRLYSSSCSSVNGGKRYSYDTITNEVRGENAWKAHHGTSIWHQMCLAKREYDPHHILGRGVGIWDGA